jgi:hypothetical protein
MENFQFTPEQVAAYHRDGYYGNSKFLEKEKDEALK